MTPRQLELTFQKDIAQRNMMWETELKKKVAAKHPGSNQLTEIYLQEVHQYLNEK